ncbi:MAG: hypothetical protein E6686_10240 [Lachnospiraceae bacterium]|nr:hypothetical protein [Lachnospiraceae bacterium]
MYNDGICKYLRAEDVSDSEALGHSSVTRYKYYCIRKNKKIMFPFICQKKCGEYRRA